MNLEHDPEKACLALDAGWVPVFPRDKRGTRLRGDRAQIKEIERDDDSKKSHHALGIAISGSRPSRESAMYAAIRQGKAKAGKAEELTRRIKEGAIPIISDVEGFMGYYVVYSPDDTVVAISLFNNYAAAEESNKRALAWIEQELAPLLTGPATAMAGPVIVHTLA
jgi:hypothetical protein